MNRRYKNHGADEEASKFVHQSKQVKLQWLRIQANKF
jgi:predicted GIY-YIG superfamily endonuclease